MAPVSQRSDADSLLWALARAQYWVLTHGQIREAGLSAEAIRHRVATGRLHRIHRGVYGVGRPQLTQLGYWMAAVLACGDSGRSPGRPAESSRSPSEPPRTGATRAFAFAAGRLCPRRTVVTRHGIPVTSPVRTLLDLALALDRYGLEAAINEADKQDLIDPESLRVELADRAGQPGVRVLRRVLDRHTFRLTDTELERRFLRIVRRAGLPLPETQVWLGGRVDFVWQDLGLVVETDGLRYHRTAISQTSDLRRDQGHAVAGRERLRFSHAQVRYEPAYVTEILTRVIQRLCRALAEPAGLEAR
jgi:very-short-patch-repair endonuclease